MSWLENQDSRGATRIWTGGRGVADLCLTTWLWHHIQLLFISILSFLGFVNPFFFSQQSAFVQKKKPRLSTEACEAPPGFEPGIEVLQTFALPLGYGTKFNCFLKGSDSKGIWTPVTAVKGRCLNRLTMAPDIFVLGSRSEKRTPPVGLEPTTLRIIAACSTDWAKEDY